MHPSPGNHRHIRTSTTASSSPSSLGSEINLSRQLTTIRRFLTATCICSPISIDTTNLQPKWKQRTGGTHAARASRTFNLAVLSRGSFARACAGGTGTCSHLSQWNVQSERWGKEERDIRQEQRAPATVFSVAAFSHVQLRADCLPQEPGCGGSVMPEIKGCL